jgi:hypothetical protein
MMEEPLLVIQGRKVASTVLRWLSAHATTANQPRLYLASGSATMSFLHLAMEKHNEHGYAP